MSSIPLFICPSSSKNMGDAHFKWNGLKFLKSVYSYCHLNYDIWKKEQ